jgi:hypothetical protein
VNAPLRTLRREIASHNRHCWLAAAGSLFLAWLAWVFCYGLVRGAVLLMATIIEGPDAKTPVWTTPAFLALAGVLLVWAGVDAWVRRFRPPSDRPIIGWHLFPDTLLLPARLTLAVGNHLDARIRLSRHELGETWRLWEWVAAWGRTPAHSLGTEFPDARTLHKSLDALQVLGRIDLHRGEDGWFYLPRSDGAPESSAD